MQSGAKSCLVFQKIDFIIHLDVMNMILTKYGNKKRLGHIFTSGRGGVLMGVLNCIPERY